MVLDKDLVKFLDKKRKSENPRDQVNVFEAFECIFQDIYKLYLEKLEERDNFDEFQVERCIGGVNFQDGVFYDRYVLPSCILLIYRLWLKQDVDEKDLREECFTIGAGSGTLDLFPEVTGLCINCASTHFPSFHIKSMSEIKQLNINVFEHQKNDKFVIPRQYSAYSQVIPIVEEGSVFKSRETEQILTNSFEDSVSEVFKSSETEQVLINPFEDSVSDEDELLVDSCDICFESFPSEEFVALHMKIFHSSNVLKTKYIDSPEELITSFTRDTLNSPASSKSNKKIVAKSKKLRKCLKYTE